MVGAKVFLTKYRNVKRETSSQLLENIILGIGVVVNFPMV